MRLAKEYIPFHPGRATSADSVVVNWYYGPSGTGKSSVARDLAAHDIYSPPSGKFWEGYDGHTFVLLDDMRCDFCKFHQLLKLLDIYPLRVEVKGGSRQLWATTIWVTSPYNPEGMWAGKTQEDIYQLERRCHNIVEFLPETSLEAETTRYTTAEGKVFGYKVHKGEMLTQEKVKARAQPVTEKPIGVTVGETSDGDDLEAESQHEENI